MEDLKLEVVLDYRLLLLDRPLQLVLVVILDGLVDAADIDVVGFALHLSSVVFAHFLCMGSFLLVVVKRADFGLVAPRSVAVDPFVLVWVVQALDCGVTLVAE